jgi:hypothetical protein
MIPGFQITLYCCENKPLSKDSLVSKVTGYRLDVWGFIPNRTGISLFTATSKSLQMHPAFCSMGTEDKVSCNMKMNAYLHLEV